MNHPTYELGIYLHLAQASKRRCRPLVRDRMLLLAGVAAANLRLERLAEYCRGEIVAHNPQHLVRKWNSFGEALMDEEFTTLLRHVRRNYSLEKSEQLLDQIGIDTTGERDAFASDIDYAASILGIDPRELTP